MFRESKQDRITLIHIFYGNKNKHVSFAWEKSEEEKGR